MPTAVAARELTVFFTDVEGSTELRERLGDASADALLRTHETIVRERIRLHEGEDVTFLGDGFLAAFSSTRQALSAAIEIQRELAAYNAEHPDRALLVRIGFHHGTASERDGTLYGQAVHGAARIAARAAGGQILVSAVVHERCAGEPDVTFLDRGLYWLKGFPQRWRLFEVGWRADAGEAAPTRTEGARPAAARAQRTPFVGREAERAELRRAAEAALAGHGSLVLVSGEAGVGKTRLTEELAAEVEARRMRVLVGHAAEMEGGTPYLPVVEILEDALITPRSPEELREAVGDAAAEIARILPALRRVLPDVPAPLDLPPEQARRYLWLSLQEFLERASRARPLMLALEDLHWADESTLLLLEYLAPRLDGLPLLVVGTYRDVEVGVKHPLARVIHQLARRRLVTRIWLDRLPPNDVAAMLRELARREPPPALVQAIRAESQGNPFFVEEVFFHLAESGRLFDERGQFRTDLRMDELDLPQSIRLLVGQRLERLADPTRAVLDAAAVAGRVFTPELLARVTDLDTLALGDALDEAEEAHVISATHDGRFGFVHELIRQTLLADTPMMKRQRLHARTAEALEALHAGDLAAVADELAHHLSRAGAGVDAARVVRYHRIAAERALQAAAFEDAATHLENALALAKGGDAAERAGLLELLAVALRSVGRWEEALRVMNEALDLYASQQRTDELGRLAWAMAYQLAWAARFREALAIAARGLAALGELPNPDRARLLSATGWVLGLAGDYDGASATFEQARALVERLDDDRARADVLHMETIHDMGYAQLERGIEAGLRAARTFEREGDLWNLVSVLAFLQFLQGMLTRVDRAAALSDRVAGLAERLGHLGALFMNLSDRVRREGVMQGDSAAVETIGRRIVEVCERGGLPWLYIGHIYLGLAAHWRGDHQEAEWELRRARELEAPGAFAGQSASLLGLHLARTGRGAEAAALVEENRSAFPVAGQVASLGSWNSMLAAVETMYLAGHAAEAGALYPLVLEALEVVGDWVTLDCRLTVTRAGIAAAAAGLWDEAERHYEHALARAEALPHRIEAADVRYLHGRMLLERGRPADCGRARALLERAAAEYRAMGMHHHAADVHRLLATAASSDHATPVGPAALAPRPAAAVRRSGARSGAIRPNRRLHR